MRVFPSSELPIEFAFKFGRCALTENHFAGLNTDQLPSKEKVSHNDFYSNLMLRKRDHVIENEFPVRPEERTINIIEACVL